MQEIVESLENEGRLNKEVADRLNRKIRKIIVTCICVWLAIFIVIVFNDPGGIFVVTTFFAIMAWLIGKQYILLIRDHVMLYTFGKKAKGTVKSIGKDKSVIFCKGLVANYEFKDMNGNLVSANTPLDKKYNKENPLKNGDKIEVLYDPGDSKVSEIYFGQLNEYYNLSK